MIGSKCMDWLASNLHLWTPSTRRTVSAVAVPPASPVRVACSLPCCPIITKPSQMQSTEFVEMDGFQPPLTSALYVLPSSTAIAMRSRSWQQTVLQRQARAFPSGIRGHCPGTDVGQRSCHAMTALAASSSSLMFNSEKRRPLSGHCARNPFICSAALFPACRAGRVTHHQVPLLRQHVAHVTLVVLAGCLALQQVTTPCIVSKRGKGIAHPAAVLTSY